LTIVRGSIGRPGSERTTRGLGAFRVGCTFDGGLGAFGRFVTDEGIELGLSAFVVVVVDVD